MHCTSYFNLLTRTNSGIMGNTTKLTKESYRLPCEDTIRFLNKVHISSEQKGCLTQTVTYIITKGPEVFISQKEETPHQAAFKIELFMKQSAFLTLEGEAPTSKL